MKKIWTEFRAFLVSLLVVGAFAMIFIKIPVPQWIETVVTMGVGFFVGARTAKDK